MASIYPVKNADGQVIYCLNFVDVHGRRKRKRIGPNLTLAKEYLHQIEVELQKARMGRQVQALSIGEAIRRFLEETKAQRAAGTFRKQEFAFRTFLKFLSSRFPRTRTLGDLTPRMVNEFKVFRLQAGKSPATVKSDLGYISHLFNWCIKMDYCPDFNPVRKVDPPRLYRKAPRVFSPEELRLIFENAGPRRDFYQALYRSGFRLDDVCHIRVQDIDLDNNLICYHNRKGRRDEWTEINDQLRPIIERRVAGKRRDDFIFPEEQATRGVKHNVLRLEFKRLLRRLDLRDGTLHDFKKTFVTGLLDAGVHPRIAQQLAHHEKLETTLSYARKPSQEQMKGAVNRLPV